MQRTALAALCLAASICAASAADKPNGWIIYDTPSQTCKPAPLAPGALIDSIRHNLNIIATASDMTEESGKVTSTDISFPSGKGDLWLHIYLFRDTLLCKVFAMLKHVDTSKYD